MNGDQALSALLAGNQRFVSGRTNHPDQKMSRVKELAKTQHPFAAVLGCADSRVDPDIIFDQGLGDLFPVRVAGNIVDDAVLGSLEYAVEHLQCPLIVVLGHEGCGAVTAAVNGGEPGTHITFLVDAIAPALAQAKALPGDLISNTVRLNALRPPDFGPGNFYGQSQAGRGDLRRKHRPGPAGLTQQPARRIFSQNCRSVRAKVNFFRFTR
jgi:carbonic anhydrase